MPEPAHTDPAASLPVCVTHHESLFNAARWTAEETTWGAFVAQTLHTGHRVDVCKEHAPLVTLYRLRPGGKRCNADVVAFTGLCLDFDDRPIAEVADAVDRLQRSGVACIWHTTWQHDGGAYEHTPAAAADPPKRKAAGWSRYERRRLILPLAQPLPPERYLEALAWVRAHYAPTCDAQAADKLCQAFYVPSVHPSRHAMRELCYFPGGGLHVELGAVPLAPVQPTAVRVVDCDTWRAVAARWRKSARPQNIDLGARLLKVLDGVSFADPGERDAVLWDLCRGMARAYPDANVDTIAELFRLSLGAMAAVEPGDHLTEHDVKEKFERARQHERGGDRLPPDRRAAIRQAFGSERSEPYTDDEIAAIAEGIGATPEDLPRTWVLQHEGEYYLLSHRGLVHCGRDALINTARVVLAPAPIDMWVVEESGRRLLERDELLERHSTPLASVALSLVHEQPRLDRQERALLLPAGRRRAIAPAFDPQIDRWLETLAGDAYPQLVAWLTHFPDLSRPLTGLVLTGPKSIGKSLLARGLARIWTDGGPCSLADAMSKNNKALAVCPFAHADESDIPRDAQGNERTDALREFVQATSRRVEDKYLRAVPLLGATRLQISANNEDVLTLNAHLSAHDLDAIAERFTHVRGRERARVALEKIGWGGLERWIEGDALAAHVLYLHTNVPMPWVGRFGVAPAPELTGTLAVRGGVRAGVIELCVRALRDPSPLGVGACVVAGALRVHLDWVQATWQALMPKARIPVASVLIKALDGLGTRVEVDGLGYTEIDPQKILAWAQESGYGSKRTVARWLEQHQ